MAASSRITQSSNDPKLTLEPDNEFTALKLQISIQQNTFGMWWEQEMRGIFSNLLNLCHTEIRQSWRQKGAIPTLSQFTQNSYIKHASLTHSHKHLFLYRSAFYLKFTHIHNLMNTSENNSGFKIWPKNSKTFRLESGTTRDQTINLPIRRWPTLPPDL